MDPVGGESIFRPVIEEVGDMRSTEVVVDSIRTEYNVESVILRDRPLGETMLACRKYL